MKKDGEALEAAISFSKAYLNIKTDWTIKKNTASLVSLSGLAQFKEVPIQLTEDIKDLPTLIDKAKQLALQHYEQSGGRIKFWGKIESYQLCYRTAYYEPIHCTGLILTVNENSATTY
jgi:hypothetical protein